MRGFLLTSGRHVLGAERDLHRDKGHLDSRPGAGPREDLVPDPLAGRRGDLEALEQPRADGEGGGPEPHEWDVVAEGGNQAAHHERHEGAADKVWDRADARAFGRGAFDDLEIEREIVDVADSKDVSDGIEYGGCHEGRVKA